MRARTRDRLLLPIALPLGILLLLALVLFGFSRILLSLEKTPATATALVVASAVLVVAAVAAGRSVIRASSLAAMTGVIAGIAMLAGGVALVTVSSPAEGGGETGGGGPALTVTASGLEFDTSSIELVADRPATIQFDNQDAGVQHNIAIYEDDSLQKVLFQGDLVTGPGTAEYEIPALPAGTYYFHCDVHPTMSGEVVVAEGGGAHGGGEPGGGTGGGPAGGGGGIQPATVTASGLAFDTDTLTIPANAPSTLEFHNEDAGTSHNIAIYRSESDVGEPLFQGEVVTGPATVAYDIPPLQPGTYYFHCDVHPTMNGTVTVG